jgi:Asp/Glu/hydantoin racemase
VASARGAAEAGFDAFVLGNFSDVGVEEARAGAPIVVVGLGEATLDEARTLGEPAGAVVLDGSGAGSAGAHDGLSTLTVETPGLVPGELLRSFRVDAVRRAAFRAFFAAAERLRDRGARSIVAAGGALMVLLDREGIESAAGLPIADGLAAAVRRAVAESARRA